MPTVSRHCAYTPGAALLVYMNHHHYCHDAINSVCYSIQLDTTQCLMLIKSPNDRDFLTRLLEPTVAAAAVETLVEQHAHATTTQAIHSNSRKSVSK
jgi:hypothetical protein